MTLTPLEYFSSLVRQDDSIPLFESALALGQDAHPELDFFAFQIEIDNMALKLKQRLSSDASHIQKLRMLNHFFFQELAFAGNINNYYDPDNSYLHCVITSRRGIPISLAVVYMELGQQIGLNMKGISFPGHFLMKLSVQSGDIVLDPFAGSGTTLIAAQMTGRAARLIEYDPFYCDTIIRRYEEFTGKSAVLADCDMSFELVAEDRNGALVLEPAL